MPIYTEKMSIYTYMQDSHLMVIISISSNVFFFHVVGTNTGTQNDFLS